MIVCFPFAFKGKQTEEEVRIGKAFIKNAVGVKLVQLSDWETPNLGTDCIRYHNNGLAQWYFEIMAEFPADEFLRLDTDVQIRELPLEVFEQPFDVACWINKGTINNGVVFVRNRMFFKDCAWAHLHMTAGDNWNDIQVATQKVIDSGKYNVLKLPRSYNFIPTEQGKYEDAKLVHFEGPIRKSWIT